MSTLDEHRRIAFAEVCGYQWYCERSSLDATRNYWTLPQLALPPEGGVGNPAWAGTVSETRYATSDEIAEAKRTLKFTGRTPYLHDHGEVYRHVIILCLRRPDIVEFRSNQYLIQEQLDGLSEREQVPPWMFGPELLVEAVLRAAGRWEDEHLQHRMEAGHA